jgi:hypothetical protein
MEDGMSFPKKGNYFSEDAGSNGGGIPEKHFASEIASALHRSFGNSRAGVKTVAGWTGANERAVKNWFSGRYGPRGEHIVVLARHSNEVLDAFLEMAGRQDLMVTLKLGAAEHAIVELLAAVRSLAKADRAGGHR